MGRFSSRSARTAARAINKIDALARLKNRIKKKSEEDLAQRIIVPREAYDPIDYRETRAFSGIGTVYGTIQLNILGREKEGTVPEKEAESLKNEIKEKLQNIKDPFSGEQFLKHIFRKEEIFKGNSLNKMPDLILVPNGAFYLFSGTNEKELFHDAHPLSFGNHIKEGIIAVSSPKKNAFNLNSSKITDVFPTILDIFGIKVPDYIDGKSIISAIVKELV